MTSGSPINGINLFAAWLKASQDLNNGVFLSNASPVYEQNNVGIYNVPSLTKAGDVQSQAVYPLASNVARNPPLGKDDASGSPFLKVFPLNSSTARVPSGSKKASCFSAVNPVIGVNQWVKCVAPCSIAQIFIAFAITVAHSFDNSSPFSKDSWNAL